jgi:predicted N-acetyltransferase YhbS
MTNTLNMRVANAEDAEAITGLINAAFEVERFFLDADRIDIDRVQKLFHTGTVLLAEDESGIVGCVYLEPNGDSMYLGLLSVAPNRQRIGLGAALIHAAERFSTDNGFHAIELWIVNVRKELPGYYSRFGFVETGTAPFPPEIKTTVPCHFIMMKKSFFKIESVNV